MNYTQHPTNNKVLGAPAGWSQKELPCGALPITAIPEGALTRMVSWWRPTKEELQAIAAGGLIQLHIIGNVHPVVAMAVDGVNYEDA